MNVKANEVFRIAKNTFRKWVCSIGQHVSSLDCKYVTSA